MTTLEDLSRNIEAMSMSSIVTDIATPPPPPPPLELERWRTLTKNYGCDRNQKRGFFSRQFSTSPSRRHHDEDPEKCRGGSFSRFSRESSVASDKSESSLGSNFSIGSKSSTLSRLFSRKSKQKSSSYSRSASIDSIVTGTWRRRKPSLKETWSTPATPNLSSNPYATWKRRGSSNGADAHKTSNISQKIRDAFNQEKQRVGKFVLRSRNLSLINPILEILLTTRFCPFFAWILKSFWTSNAALYH